MYSSRPDSPASRRPYAPNGFGSPIDRQVGAISVTKIEKRAEILFAGRDDSLGQLGRMTDPPHGASPRGEGLGKAGVVGWAVGFATPSTVAVSRPPQAGQTVPDGEAVHPGRSLPIRVRTATWNIAPVRGRAARGGKHVNKRARALDRVSRGRGPCPFLAAQGSRLRRDDRVGGLDRGTEWLAADDALTLANRVGSVRGHVLDQLERAAGPQHAQLVHAVACAQSKGER